MTTSPFELKLKAECKHCCVKTITGFKSVGINIICPNLSVFEASHDLSGLKKGDCANESCFLFFRFWFSWNRHCENFEEANKLDVPFIFYLEGPIIVDRRANSEFWCRILLIRIHKKCKTCAISQERQISWIFAWCNTSMSDL